MNSAFFFFMVPTLNRFRVYDQVSGQRIATLAPPEAGSGQTCLDVQPLALSEGVHTLGVEYADPYGSISTRKTIQVDIAADGSPSLPVRGLLSIEAKPIAAGNIRLRWSMAFASTALANPDSFDIALASDPGTVIATQSYTGESYTLDVGPFTDGQTVELMVRTKKDGVAGAWVTAQPVVADGAGPAPPVIIVN